MLNAKLLDPIPRYSNFKKNKNFIQFIVSGGGGN